MANSLSLINSSSTGAAGTIVYFDPPVRLLSMQTYVVGGTTGASVTRLEGSIDGANWSTLGSSTNTGAATTFTSTSAHLVTAARAVVTAHSAGGPVNANIVGV
jgi:hypothetical protein